MARIVPGSSAIVTKGVEKSVKALNKELRRIPFMTKKGLIKGGLYIQRRSQQRCPVDTANMKASAFTVWGEGTGSNPSPTFKKEGKKRKGVSKRTKVNTTQLNQLKRDHAAITSEENAKLPGKHQSNPVVEVGFTAAYSIYVHENTKAKHTVGQAKFLERTLDEDQDDVFRIVVDEVSI